MKRICILLLALLILFSTTALFLWLYLKSKTTFIANNQIETIKVTYKKPQYFIGKQEPSQLITIDYNPTKGAIHDWYVQNQSKVAQNQPLFEYYNPQIEQRITLKQRQLAQLTQNKTYASTNYDLAIKNLETEIAQLQTQLRTTIFAPISGIININYTYSSLNKLPLVQIYDATPIIRAKVSENDRPFLHVKDKLKIKAKNGRTSSGEIKQISTLPLKQNQASQNSKYLIEITPKPAYFFGSHVEIEIPNTQIEIPRTAIDNDQFVYLLRNKKIIKRVIKLEKSVNKKTMLITEGLKPGDVIARNAGTVRFKN